MGFGQAQGASGGSAFTTLTATASVVTPVIRATGGLSLETNNGGALIDMSESDGHFTPGADNAQDLGSASAGWRTGYFDTSVVTPILRGPEIADPSAPSANTGILYFRDNGSGKTQLVARFPTGAAQVIATEP